MADTKFTKPGDKPWQAVVRYPLNAAGKDYVVGDIHGAYDVMWAAMLAAKFDPKVDRLFVVGDMVDRGPQSIRALKFLRLPYVHAALGNHEKVFIEIYDSCDGAPPDPDIVRAVGNAMNLGNQWWLDADPAQRDALVAEFRELPIAIEVETARGLVGIVHADVPAELTWPEFVAKLRAGDQKVIEKATHSRKRIRQQDDSGVAGIDRVFVGHTPQWTGLKRFGNVYAVDTGAIYGVEGDADAAGHLTLVNLVSATASLAAAAENIRASGLVDLRDEPAPVGVQFGHYARERAPG